MNRLFFLLALAFVLPLAACADAEPDGDEVVTADGTVIDDAADDMDIDDMDMDDDMGMTDDVTVQGTIDAVPADGLTAMAPAAALANINGWIDQLDGAEFTNATEIRAGLMTLRDQLQESPLNGAAIGETLSNLGAWTTEAGAGNDGLTTLGGALSSAGQSLM